ncbi:MAG: PQQ-binding-like beta-propeller repeat protein [Planctomycetaceae bacterium]
MRTHHVCTGRRTWTRLLAAVAMTACVGLADGQDPFADDPFAPARLEPAVVAEAELQTIETAPGELQASIALSEDSTLRRQFAQVTRLAESGRHEDAAQALGRLAESIGEADVFVRIDDRRQSLRSLKTEVQRRIGELPPNGRAAYELAFGRAAQRMLDDADRDRSAVQRVATLYLHTPAGAEALYRLAALYRDRGAFPEAAACLERLRTLRPEEAERYEPHLSLRLAANRLKFGDVSGAEADLTELSRRPGSRVALIAGKELPMKVADGGSLAPLQRLFGTGVFPAGRENFTHHPGEAAHPSSTTGMPFLVPRWSRELAFETGGASALEHGRRSSQTVPALFPTIVEDLVLLPNEDGFTAYDRDSGRRLWSFPSRGAGEPGAEALWRNLANGRLSSDGHAVFLVESDATETSSSAAASPRINFNGAMALQQNVLVPNFQAAWEQDGGSPDSWAAGGNRLSALDVARSRQGNRLWSVGGASGGAEPRLAGHTFLGPPLAVHGRLYAIADAAGTVRLVVLDATTGRLDWSLDLGHGEIPLAGDPQRVQIGATPTLARGVLICPTAGGAVIAVNLAGRSLLWGYRYPRSSPPTVFGMNDGFESQPDQASDSWLDRTVHIIGDRVLLTPPESDQFYCLDFEKGDLQWQQPRGEHLFVAAADEERTLLIRHTGTTLLKTADGTAVGTSAVFPAGTSPTGHGYSSSGRYVQPLSDGSLLPIDLATGAVGTAERSQRGIVLGNLVWHDGVLYSAGPDFLRAFDDDERLALEINTRLASHPDDVHTLLRRSDRHSAAGRYAEAIADCRHAHAASPTPEAKNALVAALLDGLRHELPEAAAYDAELQRLARP